jgi:hypothetical protein
VYDGYGGRKYDNTKVKFHYDFPGKFEILKVRYFKKKFFRINFSNEHYNEWRGTDEGEQISLEMDFFALKIKKK